jgi:hypothetical protein
MNLTGVVEQLRTERDRAQAEVERLEAALTALGSLDDAGRVSRRKGHRFSTASRARMSAAQRERRAREKGTNHSDPR